MALEDLLAAFDENAPLARAKTIPAAWYFDPELAERERTHLFSRGWVVVARTAELEKTGAFVTADVAGEPIVVVRGEDGTVRGFYNVCRHRGTRVMTAAAGCEQKLRCRYHGWTYDLCGRLRGAPEFDGVEEFSREEHGLKPVHVDSWGPLVFVSLEESPPKLADFLAPMPEWLGSAGLERLAFDSRKEYDLDCNWKVFVDNYLDGGYHVNTVHPGLAGVLDYSQYRTELFAHSSVQVSPIVPPTARKDDGVTSFVRPGERAQYWWVFPNLMINSYEGVLDINLVWPLGPDRCRVFFDFYFAPDIEGGADFRRQSVEVADRIQAEDIEVCEEVQRGLRSRSYDTGRFSVKREAGGYHFHRMLAATLRGASIEEAARIALA